MQSSLFPRPCLICNICAARHPGKKNRYSASYSAHIKVNETRELRAGNGTLRARVRERSTIGSGNCTGTRAPAVDSRMRALWLRRRRNA